MTDWGDVCARVRGAASRLVPPGRIAALADAGTLERVAAGVASLPGYAAPGEGSIEGIDAVLRGVYGARLAVLQRWLGARAAALEPLFLAEDRRSLRRLLRAAAGGLPIAERWVGTTPTPSMPARLIEQLAAAGSVGEVADRLEAGGHALAPALRAAASGPEGDALWVADRGAAQAFAAAGRRAARRGDDDLRAFVADRLDLENAATAAALAGEPGAAPAGLFLVGGRAVDAVTFADACSRADAAAALAVLGPRLARGAAGPPAPAALFRWADARLRRELWGRQRLRPLGAALPLWYWLRLHEELRDLRRVVWAAALQAPAAGTRAALGAEGEAP